MKNYPAKATQGSQDSQEALLHLPLEGLLPVNLTLVVNPSMRTAILLTSTAEGEAQVLSQQRFTPNGMRVLVPLLRAYPQHCPYEALIASLFSISFDQARQQLQGSWKVAIRPVRRAISSLLAGLRALGLQVRSVRGAGYLLEALTIPRA